MNNFTNVDEKELERQADRMESAYKQRASKRSGPLEVGLNRQRNEQFTDGKTSSKRRHEDSDQFIIVYFDSYL